MSTINSREIITRIVASGGYYPGDPKYMQVVEYTSDYGDRVWSIYPRVNLEFFLSLHVHDPIVLISGGMLTDAGHWFNAHPGEDVPVSEFHMSGQAWENVS